MSKAHSGRCLCGRVTFEATGAPLWIAHCHCQSCRRNTGSVMATFAGFRKPQVRYLTGERKRYASSPGVSRSFCGDCGTPLAYEADRWPDEIHIYISTLDAPQDFPPTAHVYTAEQIPWLHLDDGLKRYPGSGQEE